MNNELKFIVRGHDSLFSALEALRLAIEGIPSIDPQLTASALFLDDETYFKSQGDAKFLKIRRTEGQPHSVIALARKESEQSFKVDILYPKAFFTSILGEPIGEISKTYIKYDLSYEGFPISCIFYRVEGDTDRRLFLEVSSLDSGAAASFVSLLRVKLDIVSEVRSIFEMFIELPEYDHAA